jgi:hypothetical protein
VSARVISVGFALTVALLSSRHVVGRTPCDASQPRLGQATEPIRTEILDATVAERLGDSLVSDQDEISAPTATRIRSC